MARTLLQDPYKTFRFQLEIDGETVAGMSSISAFVQNTEVIEYRDASQGLKMLSVPGQTAFDTITLERGLTADNKFHQWAQLLDPDEKYDNDFRKDITLNICDESGARGLSFILEDCWIQEYTALPDLDAGDNSIAIESMVLNYGWADRKWSEIAVKDNNRATDR